MDYEDMSNEALYLYLKVKVPEMPVSKVDDSNRGTVITVLKITEKIKEKRASRARRWSAALREKPAFALSNESLAGRHLPPTCVVEVPQRRCML